jgi:hypothetical protein
MAYSENGLFRLCVENQILILFLEETNVGLLGIELYICRKCNKQGSRMSKTEEEKLLRGLRALFKKWACAT